MAHIPSDMKNGTELFLLASFNLYIDYIYDLHKLSI